MTRTTPKRPRRSANVTITPPAGVLTAGELIDALAARSRAEQPTRAELRAALRSLLAGRTFNEWRLIVRAFELGQADARIGVRYGAAKGLGALGRRAVTAEDRARVRREWPLLAADGGSGAADRTLGLALGLAPSSIRAICRAAGVDRGRAGRPRTREE